MASKLSFRARALDASKPMPVYMAEEITDLPDFTAINRAVPQMPTGMEKEEETEHHLQRAIVTGLIIPTPEVFTIDDTSRFEKMYPPDYKMPRQLIHMQPFTMEQDIPDYDMDSEDERWMHTQGKKLDLTPNQFEEMMDRLEKSSGQTVVTIAEAKALLKLDDDLTIAVYDYWLNKRLTKQHPLILHVKTEKRDASSTHNPYVAFRRRTEKMQTRKNRKNDEVSYEKMLKLRRDLSRAVTLLEMVKRREQAKKELLLLGVDIFQKRYHMGDFSGQVFQEVSSLPKPRPVVTPLALSQYSNLWGIRTQSPKEEAPVKRDKRQYKKRRHKTSTSSTSRHAYFHGFSAASGGAGSDRDTSRAAAPRVPHLHGDFVVSSDDEGSGVPVSQSEAEEETDVSGDGPFAFKRMRGCTYQAPVSSPPSSTWPWSAPEEGGKGDPRFRFTLGSVSQPFPRCVGFVRRRMGRGGRVLLDRAPTQLDHYWKDLGSEDTSRWSPDFLEDIEKNWRHFRPRYPSPPSSPPPPPSGLLAEVDQDDWLPSSVAVGVEGDENSYLTFPLLPDAASLDTAESSGDPAQCNLLDYELPLSWWNSAPGNDTPGESSIASSSTKCSKVSPSVTTPSYSDWTGDHTTLIYTGDSDVRSGVHVHSEPSKCMDRSECSKLLGLGDSDVESQSDGLHAVNSSQDNKKEHKDGLISTSLTNGPTTERRNNDKSHASGPYSLPGLFTKTPLPFTDSQNQVQPSPAAGTTAVEGSHSHSTTPQQTLVLGADDTFPMEVT